MKEMLLSWRCLVWVCLCCVLVTRSSAVESIGAESPVAGATGTESSALVDSVWLAKRLRQSDLRILELGQREQYTAGHLPQAVFVDWIQDITDPVLPERYNLLSRSQMEQLLSRLGVSKDTTVVLYDKLENRLSTRMYWSLRYYGHSRIKIKILNGGEQAWSQAGQPLVTEVPIFEQTVYRIDQVQLALEANRGFIKARLNRPDFVLVDGRPTGQYSGQLPGKVYHTGKEHARRGHLPQAVNIPWKENLTAEGKFKSVNELRKLYTRHGVTPDATIVTYCNEGLHAAHPWFVLTELLGYRQVRLYDDSLSEWANTPDEPLMVGTKP